MHLMVAYFLYAVELKRVNHGSGSTGTVQNDGTLKK
jgi:hypothetical protein